MKRYSKKYGIYWALPTLIILLVAIADSDFKVLIPDSMFSDIELSVELFIPWVMRILNPDLLFFILLALVVCASLIKLILSTLPAMAIRKKMKIITPIRYLINSMIKSLVVFAGSLFAFPAWAYLFNDVALFNLVTHTKLISLLVVSCLCFYSIFVVYVSSREMCYWLVRNKTRD